MELGDITGLEVRANDRIDDMAHLIYDNTLGALNDAQIEESEGFTFLQSEVKNLFETNLEGDKLRVIVT
jgi:hypothetical protein